MGSITFNALEIFEMAEQIERNGAKFYRKAAEGFENSDMRNTLLQLAEWEVRHEAAFAAMRKQLSQQQRQPAVFDPEGESALYLQAMVDGHIFDMEKDPAMQLSGKESPEEILETAVGMEKDSVVFYLGLKYLVPSDAGRDKVEAIIKEEMNHIAILKLAALK